jgi:hypothetical protein
LSVSGFSILAAVGTSLASEGRTANSCRVKAPTVLSDKDFGATIR